MQTKINRRCETAQCAVPNETNLYLYGYICDSSGWWDDDEIITPANVRKALEDINTDIINVHINSPGGSGVASVAVYNLLTQHSATIHVYVDGEAASGASIIAMAGEKVYMPANTTMFIHHAWTVAVGNAAELRKQADDLDKMEDAVYETYMAHFKGTREELESLLDDESPLSADECLALGLCTDVIPIKAKDSCNGQSASAKASLLTKYGKKESIEPAPRVMKISAARVMTAFLDATNKKRTEAENA